MDRFDPCWLAWAFRSISTPSYFSSHHSFSFRTCRHTFQKISQKTTQSHIKVVESIFQTCSSSAGVKSFLMLKVFLISSGVLPDQIIHYQDWEQTPYYWWYLTQIIHHQGTEQIEQTLDHVGHCFTGHIKEALVKVIFMIVYFLTSWKDNQITCHLLSNLLL